MTPIEVSSSQMSVPSSIRFTPICSARPSAHIGSNTRPLMAWQASEAIETQRTMSDCIALSSNQWTAGGLETSRQSSNSAALAATHDMHVAHHAKDVAFTNRIVNAKLLRFSGRFNHSAPSGFQITECRTTEYVTIRKKVIDDSSGLLSGQAINWIRAT